MSAVHGLRRPVLALTGVVAALSVAAAAAVCAPSPVHEASPPAVEETAVGAAAPLDDAASTHAGRVALFAARLSAFRAVEARLWAAVPLRAARGVARVSATRASPLSRAEVATAVARGETDCLARAVYHEARGEPEAGQAAVAQVVLNRARSGLYPSSVCGVVFQGAERAGCQFSFACDGAIRRGVGDAVAWSRARRIAAASLGGAGAPGVDAALNYHADYVRPAWARRLARVAGIGRHVFYAPGTDAPPGATPPPAATAPLLASGA